MPTKRLPPKPNLEKLKAEARDLLAGCAARDPRACQRLREFHPGFGRSDDAAIAAARLSWSDGLFATAREYGFASWPRLKARVEGDASEGIADPVLGRAVGLLDDGDVDGLRALIAAHPDLPTRRAHFEGQNYFRTPALLAFAAENPVRNDSLPPNIVDIVELLLASGTGASDVQETLALVASGRVARESGMQDALIALLVRHGADPDAAVDAALAHGEFGALAALRACGARMTLPMAAALGDSEAPALLAAASADERYLATALAAQHGHAGVLALLLEAGEDPDRYNPVGAHSHSTPLHQAVWHGHGDAVRVLLERGARTDLRDTLWNGTPLDWARHGGLTAMVALLEGG
jgi:hypothetical protein